MSSFDRGVYAPPLRRDPGFGPIDPHVDEPRRGPMLMLLSAAVLLALVGVIWSTYHQGVRERDAPPRIAALAEPYKIQPADPGGVQAEHQGIEVYNVLEDGAVRAAIGSSADPELDVIEERLPGVEAIADWEVVEPHAAGAALVEGVEPESAESRDAEVRDVEFEGAGSLSAESESAAEESAEAAEPDRLAQAAPVGAPFAGTLTPEEMTAAPPQITSESPSGSPATSAQESRVPDVAIPRLKPLEQDPSEPAASGPRTLGNVSDPTRRYFAFRAPMTRPEPAPESAGEAGPETGAAEPAEAAAPAPADLAPLAEAPAIMAIPPEMVAPSTQAALSPPAPPIVVPGSFLVQLASFRSADAANVAWREFSGEFDDLIGAYAPDVERADLGDRGVRFRLRVGVFTDRTAASSFCDEIKARGRDCLVVGG